MKRFRTVFAAAGLAALGVTAGALIAPDAFYAELAAGESADQPVLVTIPTVPPRVDVLFAFDMTSSMSGIINAAKARAVDVMNELVADNPDVSFNFGVVSYMDYPNSYPHYIYPPPATIDYGDPDYGDYAYKLDLPLTDDTLGVSDTINALSLGYGGDGPQDYTRIFYESYADPLVGWRNGAKRILLNFGDNVPHDLNLHEGVASGTWSTGGDPGQNEEMGDEDDLDLQAVLGYMALNGVTLLEAHANNNYRTHWEYWTGLTGGDVFTVPPLGGSGDAFVSAVKAAIMSELLDPTIDDLHLAAQPGYESWIDAPGSYSGVTGVVVPFDLTVTVPPGTPGGDYAFVVSALDADAVGYGDMTITLHVNAPPDADAGPDRTVEQAGPAGTDVTLDGSGSSDPDGVADIVSYAWTEGATLLGSGVTLSRTFSAGSHTVTLTVTDTKGQSDSDEVVLVVQDTTAPEVTCTTALGALWPPNHQMVDVGLAIAAVDVADADLDVAVTVTSDEATTAPGTGGAVHAPDAVVTDNGDGTFSVLLRAERAGMGDGRVYVVTVTVTDDAGLTATTSCAVTVDASQGKKGAAVDSGQAWDATQVN